MSAACSVVASFLSRTESVDGSSLQIKKSPCFIHFGLKAAACGGYMYAGPCVGKTLHVLVFGSLTTSTSLFRHSC